MVLPAGFVFHRLIELTAYLRFQPGVHEKPIVPDVDVARQESSER
jgi:hypothetical protein